MNNLSWIENSLNSYNTELGESPINIVDIGSAGTPPLACKNLASVSIYVGFDPDLREPQSGNNFGFHRYTTIDKAITASQESNVKFYLTRYPQCSSTLLPDNNESKYYSISDFFDVLGQADASAIRLDEALVQSNLQHIDWLKLDTQGTDLDILKSLNEDTQKKLLVVDIEPGVTAFYKDENRFSDIHEFMLGSGFWLADLAQQRFPRISISTIKRLGLTESDISLLGDSPFAAELQYFRTIQSLIDNGGTKRDFFALWLLSMTNGQYAFAIETALAGQENGCSQELSQELVSITLKTCQRNHTSTKISVLNRAFSAIVPPVVVSIVSRLLSSRLWLRFLKQVC